MVERNQLVLPTFKPTAGRPPGDPYAVNTALTGRFYNTTSIKKAGDNTRLPDIKPKPSVQRQTFHCFRGEYPPVYERILVLMLPNNLINNVFYFITIG